MRILSGVQPSGKLHLGNFYGAIRQFVDLQNKGDGFYFIADLHALTSVRDPNLLRGHVMDVVLDFLALGLDPAKATLFRQSDIPEVTELTWVLLSLTPMGLLERAHSYKDKTARGIAADAGLFTYPILMAADILAYNSNLVPVGKDQKQHLEITRDVAVKFNQTYCPGFDPATGEGGILTLPDAYTLDNSAVVPGTDGQKMSKSYGNAIDLFGTDKEAKKSIMRIVTDSTALEDPKDPETCNVFALLKLMCSDAELEAIRQQYLAGGTGYGHFKTMLLEKFLEVFGPARAKRKELEQNLDFVNQVLVEGAAKAREISVPLLDKVRKAVGLR